MTSRRRTLVLLALLAAFTTAACAAEDSGRQRLFIIGQDLDSIRGYVDSACCPRADGVTVYLNFYALTSAEGHYGGLGMDEHGEPLRAEYSWGAGSNNAWKAATGFDGGLAIGLNISENHNPDGLSRIAAGELDANIRQLARFISGVEVPVWLRIGYEFDGGWNHGYENAELYVAAWRRIVDGLRAENLENVEFVWQAAAFPLDILVDGGYTDIRQWYPGDEYVDWFGISLFMRLDERPAVDTEFDPPTVRQLAGKVLDFARERGKPLIIAEASPQGYDLARGTNANIGPEWDGPQGKDVRTVSPEQIWDEWYAPMFEWMEENSDVIRALAYINCHWDAQAMWGPPYASGYWGDTRLQVSPVLAERFSAAIERWRTMP